MFIKKLTSTKFLIVTSVILVSIFIANEKVSAIEPVDMYLSPASFQAGSLSSINVLGGFRSESYEPTCDVPTQDSVADAHYARQIQTLSWVILNSSLNPTGYSGTFQGSHYTELPGQVSYSCYAPSSMESQDAPREYDFTGGAQINVAGLSAGTYYVRLDSHEGAELDGVCSPTVYFGDCLPDAGDPPEDDFSTDPGWLRFDVTSSPTVTVRVTSNVPTSYSITGPNNFSGSVSTPGGTTSHTGKPTGTYTISPSTLSCYSAPTVNANPQTAGAGNTITFSLTYTSNGSCAPGPTVDLKLGGSDGPLSVSSGYTNTLSWTVGASATSCQASWVASPTGPITPASGSTSVGPLTTNTTYFLQCSDSSGNTGFDSVDVTVGGGGYNDDSTASFYTPIPATLTPGQVVNFTVDFTNVGNTVWWHGDGYRVVQLSGLNISPASDSAAGVRPVPNPGYNTVASKTFTLTAPTTPGNYTLDMQVSHTGAYGGTCGFCDYMLDINYPSGVDAGSAPFYGGPFGDHAIANFTVAQPQLAPTTDNVSINSLVVNPNATNQYDIVVVGTDPNGSASSIIVQWAEINYGTSNLRGRLSWNSYGGWTNAKNNMSCTGGGNAGVLDATSGFPGLGDQYINLVSCRTTTSGGTRTTTFTVTFNPAFTTPTTGNDIAGLTSKGGCCGGNSGWVNFDINFAIVSAPVVSNLTISSPTVSPNGSTQYDIVVTGNDLSGGIDMQRIYALINFQGSNAGQYRGYLTWGVADYWPTSKDRRACTGDGGSSDYAVIQNISPLNVYGHQYLNLDSCSVVTSGNNRTVTFKVRFAPAFTSPITNNDISGRAYDATLDSGWTNFDLNFSLDIIPSVSYTCGSPLAPTCTAAYNGTVPLNWTSTNAQRCNIDGGPNLATSGSGTSAQMTSTTVSNIVCTNDTTGLSGNDSITINVSAPSQYPLTVTVNPGPGGVVTSLDGFINCGSSCSHNYNTGSVVTLTATPSSAYWKFAGWTGDCSGLGQCVVTVNGNKSVGASFVVRLFDYQEF